MASIRKFTLSNRNAVCGSSESTSRITSRICSICWSLNFSLRSTKVSARWVSSRLRSALPLKSSYMAMSASSSCKSLPLCRSTCSLAVSRLEYTDSRISASRTTLASNNDSNIEVASQLRSGWRRARNRYRLMVDSSCSCRVNSRSSLSTNATVTLVGVSAKSSRKIEWMCSPASSLMKRAVASISCMSSESGRRTPYTREMLLRSSSVGSTMSTHTASADSSSVSVSLICSTRRFCNRKAVSTAHSCSRDLYRRQAGRGRYRTQPPRGESRGIIQERRKGWLCGTAVVSGVSGERRGKRSDSLARALPRRSVAGPPLRSAIHGSLTPDASGIPAVISNGGRQRPSSRHAASCSAASACLRARCADMPAHDYRLARGEMRRKPARAEVPQALLAGGRQTAMHQQMAIGNFFDLERREAFLPQLCRHLFHPIGREQRLQEVAAQNRRFIGGVFLHQRFRAFLIGRSAEIHDDQRRARAGGAAQRSPHHRGVVQMMQQTVADHRVVVLERQCRAGQIAVNELHARLQALFVQPPVAGGEHGRRAVDAMHGAARIGACETNRDVGGPAAQVQHRAFDHVIRETRLKQPYEMGMRLFEIGLGIRRRLLGVGHQLGFGNALHYCPLSLQFAP